MTDSNRSLLILSFSPLASDARVLKQIRAFAPRYRVITCGYGPSPHPDVEHLEIPNLGQPGRWWDAALEVGAYWPGYWLRPEIRAALPVMQRLRGRGIDAAIANDIDALPLALLTHPRGGVHADLHEFFPRLQDEHLPWRKRIRPWYHWLCRRYLPRAASVTTVSERIAQEYAQIYQVEVGTVYNATPYHELSPTPVHEPIRLVHSGTSHRERNIDALVAAALAVEHVTLDLYLMGNDPGYLADLRRVLAGQERVRLHEPVPYDQLIDTLNGYDLGVHLLPPRNFNFEMALPNKIFDFAQARLGAIIGPSPAMVDLVERYGYGLVCEGYSAEDLIEVLRELTPQRVAELKEAAHEHARELSAGPHIRRWERAVERLMERAEQQEAGA